jgi:hypothetical protein
LKNWNVAITYAPARSQDFIGDVSSNEQINTAWLIELFISQFDVLGQFPAGGVQFG